MKHVLFALLFWASISSAHAGDKQFTFGDLKALVEKNDLRSVEQVIPLLPNEFKKNFTLMQKSRSIQRSHPEAPRALLFGDTAKLVLGFNGDPNDAGHDRLEAMEFDEKTDRFIFSFIYFAGLDTKAEVIDSPMNCIGCHGRQPQDLNPVWDVGLVWRGAYGSQDDSFAETALDPNLKAEAESYAKFLETTSNHARYKHLDFSKPLGTGVRDEIENRPNLRLGMLLTRLQVKRIARQIENAPSFAALQNTLLSQLIGCSQTKADPQFRIDVEARVRAFMTPIYGELQTEEFLRDQLPENLKAFTIGKSLGLDLGEWQLTAEKRTYAVFDASYTFKDLLAAEMLRRHIKSHPELAMFYEVEGLQHALIPFRATPAALAVDGLGGRLTSKALSICAALKIP